MPRLFALLVFALFASLFPVTVRADDAEDMVRRMRLAEIVFVLLDQHLQNDPEVTPELRAMFAKAMVDRDPEVLNRQLASFFRETMPPPAIAEVNAFMASPEGPPLAAAFALAAEPARAAAVLEALSPAAQARIEAALASVSWRMLLVAMQSPGMQAVGMRYASELLCPVAERDAPENFAMMVAMGRCPAPAAVSAMGDGELVALYFGTTAAFRQLGEERARAGDTAGDAIGLRVFAEDFAVAEGARRQGAWLEATVPAADLAAARAFFASDAGVMARNRIATLTAVDQVDAVVAAGESHQRAALSAFFATPAWRSVGNAMLSEAGGAPLLDYMKELYCARVARDDVNLHADMRAQGKCPAVAASAPVPRDPLKSN